MCLDASHSSRLESEMAPALGREQGQKNANHSTIEKRKKK